MLRKTLSILIGFAFLLALWMMYVSNPKLPELYIGIVVCILGVIGSTIIRDSGFAKFKARPLWLALFFLEPWYVLVGTSRLVASLERAVVCKASRARFRALAFDAGGDDAESSARRTLTIAYLTIPPDTVIVGIDREHNQILLHEIQETPIPLIARLLGAQE
jgi:Na+/H+ ion antiporter subunit